jgi:hypothetical protein
MAVDARVAAVMWPSIRKPKNIQPLNLIWQDQAEGPSA